MKLKFYLAGALLVSAGLLHFAVLLLAPVDTTAILPGVFSLIMGAAYVILGGYLLLMRDRYLTYTALIILFGLIVDLLLYSAGVEGIAMIMLVVEALTLAVVTYLYFQSRAPLSRVR